MSRRTSEGTKGASLAWPKVRILKWEDLGVATAPSARLPPHPHNDEVGAPRITR